MALELDASLLAAQASSSRHPVCSLIVTNSTGEQLDLSAHLTGELVASWNLDGSPNELDFTVSHGDLSFLVKDNRITLKLGENIGGVNYWADQGTFFIRELKVSYKRGTYPTIAVHCNDLRRLLYHGPDSRLHARRHLF